MSGEEKAPTVSQLIVGYVREEETTEGGRCRASGSVSLIKSGPNKIMVDCGDPWNDAELIYALQTENCKPEDVTHLIVTHGHSDHCGNLALFKNAAIIMDEDL
uniref:Metallo-beta-lactamase domain-containing protein n=1 Tax=Plectus sambesii TaxID=2011161 RepID=A0A914X4K9_9BILA